MPDPAKRVAIYVRHVPDDVHPGHVQERRCRAWADREGHEVVATYADGIMPDDDGARPAFERMLTRVRAGDADIVVALSLDSLVVDRHDRALLDALPADVVVRYQGEATDRLTPWYIGPLVMGTIASGIGLFHALDVVLWSTTLAGVTAILAAVAPVAATARSVVGRSLSFREPAGLAPILVCTVAVAVAAGIGFAGHPGLAPAGAAALAGVLAPVTAAFGALGILAAPARESWAVVGHTSM